MKSCVKDLLQNMIQFNESIFPSLTEINVETDNVMVEFALELIKHFKTFDTIKSPGILVDNVYKKVDTFLIASIDLDIDLKTFLDENNENEVSDLFIANKKILLKKMIEEITKIDKKYKIFWYQVPSSVNVVHEKDTSITRLNVFGRFLKIKK